MIGQARRRILGPAAVLAALAILQPTSAWSNAGLWGTVSSVDDNGVIRFIDHQTAYRLWGFVVDPAILREEIRNKYLQCFVMNDEDEPPFAITCFFATQGDWGRVGDRLVDEGLAVRNCSEYGYWPDPKDGTCD